MLKYAYRQCTLNIDRKQNDLYLVGGVAVCEGDLIPVVVWLVRAINGKTQVLGLSGGKLGEFDAQVFKVKAGHFLVELLGQEVDAEGVLAGLGPELDLCQDLVGEGVGHDEGGVAHGTAQVHQPALCQQDDVVARLEEVAVHLWLDVHLLHAVLVQPLDVNLDVKVANVADNGVVPHGHEVFAGDDVTAASGGDEDGGALLDGILHGGDLMVTDRF